MTNVTRTSQECQEGNFNADYSRTIDAYVAEMESVINTRIIVPDLSMLDIALRHARRGFRVFPCAYPKDDGSCSCWRGKTCPSPGKHPAHKGWQDEATSDSAAVTRLWASDTRANIGIVTDGFLVLDVDPRKGGAESLAALEVEHGPLDTCTAITGSEGLHYLFTLPDGVRCRNKASFAPGLDTRADGGFIVAAGSWHPCGGRYRWQGSYRAMAPAPAWLLEKVAKKPVAETPPAPRPVNLPSNRLEAWGAKSLYYVIQDYLREASEGNRNARLNHHAFRAGQLVGAGAVTREEAEDRLITAGMRVGLSRAEAARTTDNGLKAGIPHPRYPKETTMPARPPKREVGRPAERVERGGVALSQGAAAAYDLLTEHVQACDPGGTPLCRLTVAQVAQALQKNERTARRYLAELVDSGLCERRQTLHGCETVILTGAPDEEPTPEPAPENDASMADINSNAIKGVLLTHDDLGASLSAEFVSAPVEVKPVTRRRPLLDLIADAVDAYGIPLAGPMMAPDGFRQNKLDLIIDFVFSNEGDVYSDEQIKRAWETFKLRAKLAEVKYLSQVKSKLKSAQYHIDKKQYEGKSPAWWLWYQKELLREVKRREALAEAERAAKRHKSRRNVVPNMPQTMAILDMLMTGASDEERDAEIARLLDAGDVAQALAVADVYRDTNPDRWEDWKALAEVAR